MAENIFVNALAQKLRFPFKGSISTEDLFSLGLTDLDALYKNLKKESDNLSGTGLIKKTNPAAKTLELQIAVVTEVFSYRQAEINAKKAKTESRQKNAYIRELIAEKQNEALKGKSIEELEKLLTEEGADE
jgi:hypothetical protein